LEVGVEETIGLTGFGKLWRISWFCSSQLKVFARLGLLLCLAVGMFESNHTLFLYFCFTNFKTSVNRLW